jgi:DNA-binding SARP family transcriptional activator
MNGAATGENRAMPTVHITLLGRFAMTVDDATVADSHWARRHAAALVKVLAMAPGRRLHREQILDLLWPDDTIEEAAPKLHKAAHFARRAIGVPNSVVLRGDNVVLCPDADTTVDIVRFEDLARRALADDDVIANPPAPPRPAAPRWSVGAGGGARPR